MFIPTQAFITNQYSTIRVGLFINTGGSKNIVTYVRWQLCGHCDLNNANNDSKHKHT